jgi:hypothetical protein
MRKRDRVISVLLQADNEDLHNRWKLATRTVAYPDGCRRSGYPSNSEIRTGSGAHLKRVGEAGEVSDSWCKTGCFDPADVVYLEEIPTG